MKEISSLRNSSGDSETMHPLVVAIAGAAATQGRLAAQLSNALSRKGLKVKVMNLAGENLFLDEDVVLVRCRKDQVEKLAKRLERSWTDSWSTWYAASIQSRQHD